MQVRSLDFMFVAALAVVGFAAAAQDVRGAKDHPLVTLVRSRCSERASGKAQ
jgi:hypothetical protein